MVNRDLVTGTTWLLYQEHRPDHAIPIRFSDDGTLVGISHPNERTWRLEGETLCVYHEDGQCTVRYDEVITGQARFSLRGQYALDPAMRIFFRLEEFGSSGEGSTTRTEYQLTQKYDNVFIFCTEFHSGGPEALHQLSSALTELGCPAWLVYVGASSFEISSRILRTSTVNKVEIAKRFSGYISETFESHELTENDLIVVPEIWAHWLLEDRFKTLKGNKVLWWLSVDNAIANNEFLNDKAMSDAFFGSSDIFNLYQSEYARRFLESRGATYFPLFDFTSDSIIETGMQALDWPKRLPIVCYFPRKGGALAEDFFTSLKKEAPWIRVIALENMDRSQIAKVLCQSRIFVDFGPNPGRDRVPREAAATGNLVLLKKAGSALNFEDHPIGKDYKFTAEDVANGHLARQIVTTLSGGRDDYESQQYYRQRVHSEKQQFYMQVRNFFFNLNAKRKTPIDQNSG